MEQKKKYQSFWIGLFKWKLSEDELKNQIENYGTLGFSKSLRKLSAGLVVFSIILSLIFLAIGWVDNSVLLDILVWIILVIFIYMGQRWAIIVAIVFWTLEKSYQIYSITQGGGGSSVALIIWWAVYMGVFLGAYQVEKERKRIKK